MKFLLILVGTLAAGLFGYLTEPSLRYQLTGVPPGSAEDPVIVQFDAQGNSTRIRVPLDSLTPEQLPERVALRHDIEVTDKTTGVTMRIEAGSQVRPVRIENRELVVSPGVGAYEGRVPVTSTDLLQQLTSPRPAATAPREAVAAADTTPPARPGNGMGMGGGMDMMGGADEPADEPMVGAAGDGLVFGELPNPAEEIEPEPEAEPEMVEDTGPVEDVVATMQESVKAGAIEEFTFDQVTEWTEEENETIDGHEYQIGVATYQKETFLGVQTIQAKALIRGGKVQRWVGARSGLEIK